VFSEYHCPSTTPEPDRPIYKATLGYTLGQAVILVADDNERIRKTACSLLMDSEHLAECIEAENGLIAYQLAIARKPDLVILDYSMPVMDGLEAAKRIHEALPEMPIVLFSLYASFVKPDHEFAAIVPKEKASTMLVSAVHSLLSLPSRDRKLA
jgi:two-component system, NarL family, response regulator NreC